MGLDSASVTFLAAAKSLGVDFTRTAMIGRQSFYPDAGVLRRAFSALGIERDVEQFLRETHYGEPFFSLLGAEVVASIDCSGYEEASHIHDMNLPIPDGLREQFSVVHDGGTLEHIFNIPQALQNCMEMVRVGGHFTQVNMANNYMGHGFWQFSPELIFRVFSPANGYQIEAVLLHEVVPGGAWYAVTDPDKIKARIQLCNSLPTYILTSARRVAVTRIFCPPPQQSDYVTLWGTPPGGVGGTGPTSTEAGTGRDRAQGLSGLWRGLPAPVKQALRTAFRRLNKPADRSGFKQGIRDSHYRLIKEANLLRGELA